MSAAISTSLVSIFVWIKAGQAGADTKMLVDWAQILQGRYYLVAAK